MTTEKLVRIRRLFERYRLIIFFISAASLFLGVALLNYAESWSFKQVALTFLSIFGMGLISLVTSMSDREHVLLNKPEKNSLADKYDLADSVSVFIQSLLSIVTFVALIATPVIIFYIGNKI